MNNINTVYLRPKETTRIVAGHPWVYNTQVSKIIGKPGDGSVVQVKDSKHRFLGLGFFNSTSKIQVRILTKEKEEINKDFFYTRIKAALEHRKRFFPRATSYRVVNAEGDFLSGLVVDKYEDVLVVQISSLGMEMRKSEIIQVLDSIFSPVSIIERNDISTRKLENLPETVGVLKGTAPDEIKIKINGLDFFVSPLRGHKTGCYLDQQENYSRTAYYATGGRVLDCFCFQGGFSIHAAKAGAIEVLGIDQSADALAIAEKNARANGVTDICRFECSNVFDWLKARTSVGPNEKLIPRFDLIILDPPSFTRTRSSLDDALRGYKEIHIRALKLLKRGGILATFCCSHHVDTMLFQDTIMAAAFDTRRILRRLESFSQSKDHPIIPAIPETEYLKGFAFEVQY